MEVFQVGLVEGAKQGQAGERETDVKADFYVTFS